MWGCQQKTLIKNFLKEVRSDDCLSPGLILLTYEHAWNARSWMYFSSLLPQDIPR